MVFFQGQTKSRVFQHNRILLPDLLENTNAKTLPTDIPHLAANFVSEGVTPTRPTIETGVNA